MKIHYLLPRDIKLDSSVHSLFYGKLKILIQRQIRNLLLSFQHLHYRPHRRSTMGILLYAQKTDLQYSDRLLSIKIIITSKSRIDHLRLSAYNSSWERLSRQVTLIGLSPFTVVLAPSHNLENHHSEAEAVDIALLSDRALQTPLQGEVTWSASPFFSCSKGKHAHNAVHLQNA